MFRGINSVRLDVKGRFAMPTKYRNCLSKQVVLTMDLQDPCLLLYEAQEFEIISKKINALPSFNEQAKQLRRRIIGLACDCELDGQFRILIPPTLREYAMIGKNMMMIGQGNKFEIWDEVLWNKERADWKQISGDMSEQVAQLSI